MELRPLESESRWNNALIRFNRSRVPVKHNKGRMKVNDNSAWAELTFTLGKP
jgi:hypothetical protein